MHSRPVRPLWFIHGRQLCNTENSDLAIQPHSHGYTASAIITQPRFILCRCRSQTFKVFGKQSRLMQLALWQAEASSHIKTKPPQWQEVGVMLQLWHGGANNTHIHCWGYVTSPRHLSWDQSPQSTLLSRGTLLTASSLWDYSVVRGDLF